ncbi:hypothetical protein CRUP_009021 [Coryphaenoides rupestris]|nr:hypothetical protein CRUP_009021 [Coryphaenoides rupestris]
MMTDQTTPNAFKAVSRKPGLQIWTINNMEMVPVPAQGFGNFFEGDCYLVLFRSTGGSADIHYWIGGSSSQDEQGAAAILVSQLDETLGGSPVQHREGGVASGFQHVETNCYSVLRLLRVKGRKNVTAAEVDMSWNSFNKGDIFLLDMGKAIIQWNGPQSNRREKLKAVLLAQDIRDRERGGRAQISVVEGSDEEDYPELMKVMKAVLGQRSGQLKDAIPDQGHDMAQSNNDCYIADQGGSSVMVWKGKQASPEERRSALSNAVGFIKAKNYPASTNVEVWRIEQVELAEVNPSTYGQFYGGDCYLVLYTYQRSNRPQYILYMWQVGL